MATKKLFKLEIKVEKKNREPRKEKLLQFKTKRNLDGI